MQYRQALKNQLLLISQQVSLRKVKLEPLSTKVSNCQKDGYSTRKVVHLLIPPTCMSPLYRRTSQTRRRVTSSRRSQRFRSRLSCGSSRRSPHRNWMRRRDHIRLDERSLHTRPEHWQLRTIGIIQRTNRQTDQISKKFTNRSRIHRNTHTG